MANNEVFMIDAVLKDEAIEEVTFDAVKDVGKMPNSSVQAVVD